MLPTEINEYQLEQYVLAHSDREPSLLQQLSRETMLKRLNGRMVSGHLQGRLLVMLCQVLDPLNVLDLGTFTGYSAICFAEGTRSESSIHTIERNKELEEVIQYWVDKSGYSDKIHLHLGNAVEIIPSLNCFFDLVYLDIDKREYLTCFETVFPYVRQGGIILADNTLWNGKILVQSAKMDAQTLAISTFNDYIASDSRVEKVMLPIRDGLTIIRKK